MKSFMLVKILNFGMKDASYSDNKDLCNKLKL